MKNNIEYYQHFCDSDQHAKFKMLRVKYGWEGEGRFWALNNRIGLAENCNLDLSKKYNKASIASDLSMTINEFNEFIDYLNKECNLIKKNGETITTEITAENLSRTMKKRKRNLMDYLKITETKIESSKNIQSKVKESKVNKKITNNLDKKLLESAKKLTQHFLNTLSKEQRMKITSIMKKKWTECYVKVLKDYDFDRLLVIVQFFRTDEFWRKNFQSPLKLLRTNKDGIRYVDYFADYIKPIRSKPMSEENFKSDEVPDMELDDE